MKKIRLPEENQLRFIDDGAAATCTHRTQTRRTRFTRRGTAGSDHEISRTAKHIIASATTAFHPPRLRPGTQRLRARKL